MNKAIKLFLMSALFLSSAVAITAEEKTKKEESLYVVLDANGNVTNKQVNVNINSDTKLKNYKDKTNLKNIEIINSDEDLVVENNKIIWNTDSKNVQYKGDFENKLPLKPTVNYRFNGNKKMADEIVGLDGNLEMEIKFHNDDKVKDVLTPYIVLSIVPFDENHFSNIEIENAVIKTDGQTSYVISLRVPGFKEFEKLNDSVKIRAKVSEFKMDSAYFIAFPADMDFDEIKDEINRVMDETLNGSKALREGTDALEKGAAELKDGSGDLYAGSNLLLEALDQAKSGSFEVTNGQNALLEGQAKFHSGLLKISDGLNEARNAKELVEGSQKIQGGMHEIITGSNNLSSGLNNLYDGSLLLESGAQKLSEGVDLLNNKVSSIDEEALMEYLNQFGKIKEKITLMPEDQKQAMIQMLGLNQEDLEIVATVEKQLKEFEQTIPQLKGQVSTLKQGADVLKEGTQKNKMGIDALKDGSQKLNNGMKELESNYTDSFHPGLVKLNEGIQKLALGQGEIVSANEEIMNNSKRLTAAQRSLSQGLSEIYANDVKLNDGIGQIHNGMNSLHNGTVKLNDGVNQLFEGFAEFTDDVLKLENNRISLTGENGDTDHSYKIVMKMSSIEKIEEVEEIVEEEEKRSFWDWLFRRDK